MTNPMLHNFKLESVPEWLTDFIKGCGLKFDFRTGPFLAGGSIRRAVQWNLENYTWKPDRPPDYDVFCHSKNQWEQVCDQLLGVGAEFTVENQHYANFVVEEKDWKIQVVKRKWYKNAEELLADFDFTICQFAIDSDLFVLAPQNAQTHLAFNKLVVNKIDAPLSSFVRLIKYSKQGFRISGEDLVNFMEQCQIQLGQNTVGEWESYIHTNP